MSIDIDKKGKLALNPEKAEIDTKYKASEDDTIAFGKDWDFR